MPLFTDVAGTVRVDCTVPDDDTSVEKIPRCMIDAIFSFSPSTIHSIVKPLPLQWNRAFSPTSALTDTGLSVSAGILLVVIMRDKTSTCTTMVSAIMVDGMIGGVVLKHRSEAAQRPI